MELKRCTWAGATEGGVRFTRTFMELKQAQQSSAEAQRIEFYSYLYGIETHYQVTVSRDGCTVLLVPLWN